MKVKQQIAGVKALMIVKMEKKINALKKNKYEKNNLCIINLCFIEFMWLKKRV